MLTPAMRILELPSLRVCHQDRAGRRSSQPGQSPVGMKVHGVMLLAFVTAVLLVLPAKARSQSLTSLEDFPATAGSTASWGMDLTYVRPTQRTKVNNFLFDAFGPYPVVGAAFAAGINQISNAPPEWNQGVKGYAKRFGSDYGIATVSTTTRYALSAAFKEDALYYRCECRGVFPRLRHAAISTLTSRRGEDGHRVFSFPALVAPYAGSMTAVYGWYPDRYGAKDAFRTGNYSLLVYMGGNIALEFFHSGPRSLLHRMHLNNAHGSPEPGPNQ
jgi:hypothetical protein